MGVFHPLSDLPIPCTSLTHYTLLTNDSLFVFTRNCIDPTETAQTIRLIRCPCKAPSPPTLAIQPVRDQLHGLWLILYEAVPVLCIADVSARI
jgi:hypothetical protein